MTWLSSAFLLSEPPGHVTFRPPSPLLITWSRDLYFFPSLSFSLLFFCFGKRPAPFLEPPGDGSPPPNYHRCLFHHPVTWPSLAPPPSTLVSIKWLNYYRNFTAFFFTSSPWKWIKLCWFNSTLISPWTNSPDWRGRGGLCKFFWRNRKR